MTKRDLWLFLAVMAIGATAWAIYGSPCWREQPCEARWEACRSQLTRSGKRVGELTRMVREHCR